MLALGEKFIIPIFKKRGIINSNNKINPEIFKTWMDILKKTTNTVLWLLYNNDETKQNLYNEAGIFSKENINKEKNND